MLVAHLLLLINIALNALLDQTSFTSISIMTNWIRAVHKLFLEGANWLRGQSRHVVYGQQIILL